MDAKVDQAAGMNAELQAPPARAGLSLRWLLMGGGVLLAIVAGLWYYLASGRYVSTDDSSVQAAQATISANVPGRVVELDVYDNQTVQRGQVLYQLDARPYQIAVDDK